MWWNMIGVGLHLSPIANVLHGDTLASNEGLSGRKEIRLVSVLTFARHPKSETDSSRTRLQTVVALSLSGPGSALGFRSRGAAEKLLQVGVAEVAEVLDSDFASEESVSGVLTQRREELNTGAEPGIFLCVLAECDEIQHFYPLPHRTL